MGNFAFVNLIFFKNLPLVRHIELIKPYIWSRSIRPDKYLLVWRLFTKKFLPMRICVLEVAMLFLRVTCVTRQWKLANILSGIIHLWKIVRAGLLLLIIFLLTPTASCGIFRDSNMSFVACFFQNLNISTTFHAEVSGAMHCNRDRFKKKRVWPLFGWKKTLNWLLWISRILVKNKWFICVELTKNMWFIISHIFVKDNCCAQKKLLIWAWT